MEVGSQFETSARGMCHEVSVLFSEISGYGSLTKDLESQEVADLLHEYFESMVEAVYKYKERCKNQIEIACVGNSLIAVFGSPQPLENHAWLALQTAIEMRQKLEEVNRRRRGANKPAIEIGMGINSDTAIGAQIASKRPLEFSAIGEGVNLGFRLEGVSRQYGCDIVLGENTYHYCADRIWARELDTIRIRDNHNPIAIYQFLGLNSEPIPDDRKQLIEHYDKGRELYLNRKFAIAMGEFATVLEIDSNDKAAAFHLKRCQRLLREPPKEPWDGAWTLVEN
ncbi:adenylate/guanylate cyclase domain-containing protein [Oxynema sp. CENA135]|uniref:adenylate/guanylate cyclase domain-containing protein n=1 Tax=Oxynema sp. CENA135 TaxID=984206 RepID=UPI001F219A6A|nr:adenylate/guanylate cyclase domain-containing protein [Oxynema sp. CENA135]